MIFNQEISRRSSLFICIIRGNINWVSKGVSSKRILWNRKIRQSVFLYRKYTGRSLKLASPLLAIQIIKSSQSLWIFWHIFWQGNLCKRKTCLDICSSFLKDLLAISEWKKKLFLEKYHFFEIMWTCFENIFSQEFEYFALMSRTNAIWMWLGFDTIYNDDIFRFGPRPVWF